MDTIKTRVLQLQRNIHERAKQGKIRRVYNLTYDENILSYALQQISSNNGALTAGIDGINRITFNEDMFEDLRNDLRKRNYQPGGIRRAYIPKQNGELRPLGIPNYRDRVVQASLKLILEPITEAHFLPESNGFRPKRGAWDILANLGSSLVIGSGAHYHWCIEADLVSAFDNVHHKLIINQLQQWLNDNTIKQVLSKWMKSSIFEGSLTEFGFKPSLKLEPEKGTPQGGVISPLLFNIALHPLDVWYSSNFNPYYVAQQLGIEAGELTGFVRRFQTQRRRATFSNGKRLGNYRYFRFADDFIILGCMSKYAIKEVMTGEWYKPLDNLHWRSDLSTNSLVDRRNLEEVLNDLGLELSVTKTKISHLSDGVNFLGTTTKIGRRKSGKYWIAQKPEEKRLKSFLRRLKTHTSSKTYYMHDYLFLRKTNQMTRGWAMYFRYCRPRTRLYSWISYLVWWRVSRWLYRKHNLADNGGWKVFRRKFVKPYRRINAKGNEYLTNRIVVSDDCGRTEFLFYPNDISKQSYPKPVYDYRKNGISISKREIRLDLSRSLTSIR